MRKITNLGGARAYKRKSWMVFASADGFCRYTGFPKKIYVGYTLCPPCSIQCA